MTAEEVAARYAAQMASAAQEIQGEGLLPGSWMALVASALQTALLTAARETGTVHIAAAAVQALGDIARSEAAAGIRQMNER